MPAPSDADGRETVTSMTASVASTRAAATSARNIGAKPAVVARPDPSIAGS